MSFFDLAQRRVQTESPLNKSVGPGSYLVQRNSSQRPGYAPFGSLSTKNWKKKTEQSLGPGQYNVGGQLLQPIVSKFENRNIIIVKINNDGCHQFKSAVHRFKTLQKTEIGPGTYEVSVPKRKSRSTTLKKPKINEKIKKINQSYNEKNQPTLTTDPLPTQIETKNNEIRKPKGVVSWDLNKKERFSIDIKEQQREEDKQRALSQLIGQRRQKTRPTAVFASKSIKSHIETQIYKTNNPFKAQLRKMINFKDDRPGPGAYDVKNALNTKTPRKFQFFGSTVERFPEVSNEKVIGPGSYQVEGHIKKSDDINFPYERDTKEERHSYLPTNLQNPGPGSYEVNAVGSHTSLSQKKISNPFGSSNPRFHEPKSAQKELSEAQFEMTMYYRQKHAKKDQELKLRRQMQEKQPSAIFMSGSKRFQQANQQQLQIGCYDVMQNDISARVMQYQRVAKQLEECQLSKPPFLSSEERFRNVKIEESQHKDCWCMVKSVEKQVIERESPAFACGQKRQIFEQSGQVPPVGYYETSDRGIVKGSFNSRFRKKTENQVKRSNILKRENSDTTNSGFGSGFQEYIKQEGSNR